MAHELYRYDTIISESDILNRQSHMYTKNLEQYIFDGGFLVSFGIRMVAGLMFIQDQQPLTSFKRWRRLQISILYTGKSDLVDRRWQVVEAVEKQNYVLHYTESLSNFTIFDAQCFLQMRMHESKKCTYKFYFNYLNIKITPEYCFSIFFHKIMQM